MSKPVIASILVNAVAAVQINLPDVRVWVQQRAGRPATAFDKTLTVKDIGGNASNFNIVRLLHSFSRQLIIFKPRS